MGVEDIEQVRYENFLFFFVLCQTFVNFKCLSSRNTRTKNMALKHLTKDTFKQKIFNFEENTEWKFEGNLPVLIDFYADWCAPCKMVAPVLEELAEEYKGKIDIYKVDTEDQNELAAMFMIQSIPSLLFIPKEGQPAMAKGAMPKDTFKKVFSEILKAELD